jgi:hypothetical protein
MLQNIKKHSKHIFFFMIGFYSLGLGIFAGQGDQPLAWVAGVLTLIY